MRDTTTNHSEPEQITVGVFQQRLAALTEGEAHAGDVALFSDLDRAKARELRRSWPALPAATRRKLVRDMAELAEEQIEYNFSRALKVALRDADPAVRAAAIEGLWEDDGEDFLAYLLDEAPHDESAAVRLAAVRALARFSLLAVQDEIGDRWFRPLRDRLLALVRGGESPEVRRRALEALAVYSGDAEVADQIAAAYASPDEALRTSALFSMGRNLDERWLDTILEEMDNPVAALRYEATRACGAFGDRRAVPRLLERLGDDDREVQLAAIGSLGQIGGDAALKILRRLAVSKDDVVREAAEEAIDEAAFMSNPLGPGGRLQADNWG